MVRKSMKMKDTGKNRTILQKQIIPQIQKQLFMGEFFEKENKPTLDEFTKISFSMNKNNRRNLYQMRHTFASQMLSNNEDILWVSKMLGHKDSSITLQKYARYIPKEISKKLVF